MFSFLVLLLSLSPLFIAGCDNSAPSLAPPDLQFAFADGGTIYLVNGDGSNLKRVIGGGYSEATLSPDRTKVACIQPGDFYISVYNLNAQGEPEGKPKSIYNSDAMHALGGLGKSWSPLWSPDGNRIYFLNENYLVCYDYQAQHTSTVAQFPEDQYGNELSHSFPKDRNTLYAITHDMYGMNTIWSLDLGSGQAVSLTPFEGGGGRRLHLPDSLPEEACQALFGSKENPVSEPIIPPGDRFYFYPETKSNRYKTSRVLTGYDRSQKLKFEVTTIDRYFHLFDEGRTDYYQN